MKREAEFERLCNELSETRANLEESTEQLTEKSKELASVKTELLSLNQQHSQSEQQVCRYSRFEITMIHDSFSLQCTQNSYTKFAVRISSMSAFPPLKT